MYAITGATGNTGKIVAEQLLAAGKRVRVLGRNAERLQELKEKGGEPFVCDITDAAQVKQALEGVQAVYAMEPPMVTSNDYRAFQDKVVDNLAAAIRVHKVPFAVTLSSLGADKPEGTGMIEGQYYLEQTFNAIEGLNVRHLRAGYFMENTLPQATIYKMMGTTGGPVAAEVKLPLIATQDIAAAATQELLNLEFTGASTRELHGQRDLSMAEAMQIFGKAIGAPNLAYQQWGDEQVRPALLQMGMSENVANLLLELAAAYSSGHVRALEPRSTSSTMPTSYEQFVQEVMLPMYQGAGKG